MNAQCADYAAPNRGARSKNRIEALDRIEALEGLRYVKKIFHRRNARPRLCAAVLRADDAKHAHANDAHAHYDNFDTRAAIITHKQYEQAGNIYNQHNAASLARANRRSSSAPRRNERRNERHAAGTGSARSARCL